MASRPGTDKFHSFLFCKSNCSTSFCPSVWLCDKPRGEGKCDSETVGSFYYTCMLANNLACFCFFLANTKPDAYKQHVDGCLFGKGSPAGTQLVNQRGPAATKRGLLPWVTRRNGGVGDTKNKNIFKYTETSGCRYRMFNLYQNCTTNRRKRGNRETESDAAVYNSTTDFAKTLERVTSKVHALFSPTAVVASNIQITECKGIPVPVRPHAQTQP